MSAYSEWKAGMITEAEYNSLCREEEWDDAHYNDDEEEVFEEDEIDEL